MSTALERIMARFPKYDFGFRGTDHVYFTRPAIISDGISGSPYQVIVVMDGEASSHSHSKDGDDCKRP